MNLSWQNIELDLLFDAGYDGRELVKTTQDAQSIRATEPRQAGLRLLDDVGDVVAALGAEFLPDQSGQLLVLVVSSGEMDLPEGVGPQPGLSRDLAWEVLGGAVGDRRIAELGAGVLRFDRALMTDALSEGDFRWLASSVVRMLAADAESLQEEQIAEVLGIAYEPRPAPPEPSDEPIPLPGVSAPPAELPEPDEEAVGLIDETVEVEEEPAVEAEPDWFAGAMDEPEPPVEAVAEEDWTEAEEEAEEAAEPEFEWPFEPEAEAAEEPVPPFDESVPGVDVDLVEEPEDEFLDEAQADLLRVLMQDIEPPAREEAEPAPPPSAAPAPVDETPLAGMPSQDEIAKLVEALRGIAPSEEEIAALFEDQAEAQETAAEPEPSVEAEPPVQETDWMVDYEAILMGDEPPVEPEEEAAPAPPEVEETAPPVAREDDVWWGELELWDEKPATAGPLPLRDLARSSEPPAEEPTPELEPEQKMEEPPAVEAARTQYPQPRRPSSLDTRPLEDTRPAPPVTIPEPEPETLQPAYEAQPELPAEEEAERYEYPPPARERSLTGVRTEYYLCAACGRYSAEKVGPNSYRCRHCSAVIEYRLEPPHAPAGGSEPEP